MSRLNYSRLSDHLLAGAMPHSRAHVDALVAEGVAVVVNLCELREYWAGERDAVLEGYAAAGIRELHLPVKDGATVPDGVIDAAIRAQRDEITYVHCRGGRERSAAVATAMLATAHRLTITQALAMAQVGRPVFRPLPWQLESLHAWSDARVTG